MKYQVESNQVMVGPMMPVHGTKCLTVRGYALAISVAAKSFTKPSGNEIRVVHLPSGEVVFRKSIGWFEDDEVSHLAF
jgi:hypothetical protein